MRATTTVILPTPRRVTDFARAFDTGRSMGVCLAEIKHPK